MPFVKQYTKIIDFYSNSGHIQHIYADKQFSLGVICSLLCNHEEFIEEMKKARKTINDVIGLDKPNTGIMFALPVSFVEGLGA